MKSLRIRIVLTWICYIVIAASLTSKSSIALIAMAICAIAASLMRSIMLPAFSKRTRSRLVYWAIFLTVVGTLMLGAWVEFADSWNQILVVGCWILMAISLGFQAFEDAKVWRGANHGAKHEVSLQR
jgi:hypothetical protein